MSKRLEVIQVTRRGHTCSSPECKKRIPGFKPAVVLIQEEVIDGEKEKLTAYFCNIDCYNAYEAGIIYAPSVCCGDFG